jgi:hypothetical protein
MNNMNNPAINPDPKATAKNLYRELIHQTLIDNKVASIRFTPEARPTTADKFFEEIVLHADLTLTVIHHGLQFDNLYFDYTNDYARCLSYIEDAIYCEHRNMKVTDRNYHGLTVEFAK